MAEFQTLDLGRILQTAEAIKGMRNDSITSKLQQQYMGTRNEAMKQDMAAQQRQQEVTFGREKAAEIHRRLQYVKQSPNPKNFIEQNEPDLAKQLTQNGVDWNTIDDATVMQMVDGIMAKAGAEAGIGPTPQMQEVRDQSGALLQKNSMTGEMKQVVAPQKPDHFKEAEAGRNARSAAKPKSQFQALTPEEVAAAGLPAGSSAQKDVATGKIDVLSKRDQTATLSQKDSTTAKMKLNTVSLARQQLNNIRQRFQPLKGTASAGPFGQGKLPTKEGRLFDRSVDQMRSTLTALTRVPGVGAMSDYETKLDQSKFPTRQEYEEVTQQQIDDLDNMLNAIETGYKDLLTGGQPSAGATGTWQKGAVINHASGAKIEILD